MAQSHRVFYLQQQGRIPKNFNLGGFNVTRRSVVLITAGQFVSGGPLFDQDVRLTVHGPDVYVTNICPHGPEGGLMAGSNSCCMWIQTRPLMLRSPLQCLSHGKPSH
jgi:hypothetical protein